MPNKQPYQMYPGKHSEVNPGNFKGSEMIKYKAFLYNNPLNTDDKKSTLPPDTPERLAIKKQGRELQNALTEEKKTSKGMQTPTIIQLEGAIEEMKKKLKSTPRIKGEGI